MFKQVTLVVIALAILLAMIASIGAIGLLRIRDTDNLAISPLGGASAGNSETVPQNKDTSDVSAAALSGPQGERQSDPPKNQVRVDPPAKIVREQPPVPILNLAPPVFPLGGADPANPANVDIANSVPAHVTPSTIERIVLKPAEARLHGGAICRLGDQGDIVAWTRSDDWVDWPIRTSSQQFQPYYVELTYACGPGFGGDFNVSAGRGALLGHSHSTGSWKQFKTERVGVVLLANGSNTLSLKPLLGLKRNLMQLRRVELIPADSQAVADDTPAQKPPGDGSIDNVALYDISSMAPVLSIADGTTIDLGSLPNRNLTILAQLRGHPGSVRFEVDGLPATRVENQAPFTLAGRDLNRLRPWGLSMGEHTVRITAFTGVDGTGSIGDSLTVHFRIAWLVTKIPY
jgi:hypothetical protein